MGPHNGYLFDCPPGGLSNSAWTNHFIFTFPAKQEHAFREAVTKMSDAEVTGENLVGKSDNTVNLNAKRQSYLAWEDYFMSIAFLSAQRSKDPSTQVGACIVNNEKKIVGIGYNGMPTGCSDDILPWSRVGEEFCDTKYAYGNYIYRVWLSKLENSCGCLALLFYQLAT